jgi:hypothetical protein
MMADGSTGTSEVEAGVASTSEVFPELASAAVFPDLVCFDGFAVSRRELSPASALSA